MTRIAVEVPAVAPPAGHFSHAVSGSGRWLFVAGQVPLTPDGELAGEDATTQTRQVVDNLRAVLAAAGGTLDDVVKTTVFLTDLADRPAVGAVRRDAFADPPPANTLVVVSSLADPAFRVEVEAIALLPDPPAR